MKEKNCGKYNIQKESQKIRTGHKLCQLIARLCNLARKNYTAEQIIDKLREVKVKLTRFNNDIENQIIRGSIKTEAGIDRPIAAYKAVRKYLQYFLSLNGKALLCKPDGSAYTTPNFRDDYYYKILERLGISRLTPHKCRHTLESLMLNSGCDEVAILKTMGHKDFAFSVTTYGHAEYEFLHQEMDKINFGG